MFFSENHQGKGPLSSQAETSQVETFHGIIKAQWHIHFLKSSYTAHSNTAHVAYIDI